MIAKDEDKGKLIAVGRKLEAEGLVPFNRSKYKDLAAYTARIMWLARRLDDDYKPTIMLREEFMQNRHHTSQTLINMIRDHRTGVAKRIALMYILKEKIKMAEEALDAK